MDLVLRSVSDMFEEIPVSFKYAELRMSHIDIKLGKFSSMCFHECL